MFVYTETSFFEKMEAEKREIPKKMGIPVFLYIS